MDSEKTVGVITILLLALLVSIGIPLGYVGLQLVIMPNSSLVLDTRTFGLLLVSYAFYVGLLAYNKFGLHVGVVRVLKRGGRSE